MTSDTLPARVVFWLITSYAVLSFIALAFVITVAFSPLKLFVNVRETAAGSSATEGDGGISVVPSGIYTSGLVFFASTLFASVLGIYALQYEKKTWFIIHVVLSTLVAVIIVVGGIMLAILFNSSAQSEGFSDSYDSFLQNFGDFFVALAVDEEQVAQNEWFNIQERFECCGVDAETLLRLEEFNAPEEENEIGRNLTQAEFNELVLSGPECFGVGTDGDLATSIEALEAEEEPVAAVEAAITSLIPNQQDLQFCRAALEQTLENATPLLVGYIVTVLLLMILHLYCSILVGGDENYFASDDDRNENRVALLLPDTRKTFIAEQKSYGLKAKSGPVHRKSKLEEMREDVDESEDSVPVQLMRVKTISPGLKEMHAADELQRAATSETDGPSQPGSTRPLPPPELGVGSSLLNDLEGRTGPPPGLRAESPSRTKRTKGPPPGLFHVAQSQPRREESKRELKKLRLSQLEREFSGGSSFDEVVETEPRNQPKRVKLPVSDTPLIPSALGNGPPVPKRMMGDDDVDFPDPLRELRGQGTLEDNLQDKLDASFSDILRDDESALQVAKDLKLTYKRPEDDRFDERELQQLRSKKITMTAPPPYTDSLLGGNTGRLRSAELRFVPEVGEGREAGRNGVDGGARDDAENDGNNSTDSPEDNDVDAEF